MKTVLLIFLIVILMQACSSSCRKGEIEYVKIYNLWNTDSADNYNKGWGVYWFLLHDFKTGKTINRFPISTEPVNFKTYSGKIDNQLYIDTILNAIQFLRQFPEGELPIKDTTSNYCGPALEIEFKDAVGTHFYSFILQGEKPLEELADFFFRLKDLGWEKEVVNNNIINSDGEAVNALIKSGEYHKIFPPYKAYNCSEGVDLNKLYGSWRVSGHRYTHTYNRIEFTKDGEYIYESIRNDSSVYLFSAKFTLDKNNNLIILNKKGSIKKLMVLKLTDECFEYEDLNRKFKSENTRIK